MRHTILYLRFKFTKRDFWVIIKLDFNIGLFRIEKKTNNVTFNLSYKIVIIIIINIILFLIKLEYDIYGVL